MNPGVRLWHEIVEPYRRSQWDECIRLVRRLVDHDPYDIPTRCLLATLHMKDGENGLALLQYERLLPMTVGQGDLVRALCTQRRLDELHPSAAMHEGRYRAMQEWFRYLVPGDSDGTRVRNDPGAALNGFSKRALIGLNAEAFAFLAESSKVVALSPGSGQHDASSGLLWLVYYGRVRWRVAQVDGTPQVERTAEEGDALVVPVIGAPPVIEVTCDVPAEVLVLDPAFIERVGGCVPDPDATPTPEAERTLGAAVAPAAMPPGVRRSILPKPDPFAEPMLAAGADFERRRETRVAVRLIDRIAVLGEMGASVSPLHGEIVDASVSGLGVCFPATQLESAEGIFEGAMVPVRMTLPGLRDPMLLTARVAWIRTEEGAGAGSLVRMGLEFVAISAENRSRLVHMLDEVARSGVQFGA